MRWARKRHDNHGKFSEVKDSKNLHGYPSERIYKKYKSDHFPQIVEKHKQFRKLKETLRKI